MPIALTLWRVNYEVNNINLHYFIVIIYSASPGSTVGVTGVGSTVS